MTHIPVPDGRGRGCPELRTLMGRADLAALETNCACVQLSWFMLSCPAPQDPCPAGLTGHQGAHIVCVMIELASPCGW